MVTATEEFGIAAVEAQAAGRPVIARRGGGVLEYVEDGRTGHLWEGGPAALAAAVREFDAEAVDPKDCMRNARRFSAETFREAFPHEVAKAIHEAPAERGEEEHRRRLRTRLGPRVRGDVT